MKYLQKRSRISFEVVGWGVLAKTWDTFREDRRFKCCIFSILFNHAIAKQTTDVQIRRCHFDRLSTCDPEKEWTLCG